MTIAKELQDATALEPKAGETAAAFTTRLMRFSWTDEAWEELSQEAQEWYNSAVDALEKHQDIPALPGFEAVADAEEAAEEGEAPAAASAKSKSKKKGGAKKAPAKAAKKQPAKGAKKAVAKTAGARRGPRGGFTETDKIKLLVKDNPYRAKSQSHAVFAKYKNNMTVKAALEAGITKAYLRWDAKKQHISIGA